MDPYKRFYESDNSGISVEHWEGSLSQDAHKHKYYEFIFIEKGSCTHTFAGEKTLLIPGDSILVRPESAHGFIITQQTSIYNCQFYEDKLDATILSLINEEKQINTTPGLDRQLGSFEANINKQGIVHLDTQESMFLLSLLGGMCKAQAVQGNHDILLKQKYTEIMLIIYKKRSDEQYKNYFSQPVKNQSLIMNTLAYIEANLTEVIDFNEYAKNQGLSPNHFRKLFKDVTGLSPVEYINRLRITKACHFLRDTELSMSEVAANVGIYDANYFSRLFKNYMGYSPKHLLSRNK